MVSPERRESRTERLERLRQEYGYDSKRSFWKALLDGRGETEPWPEEEAISYEAVRRYHGERDVPASYLERVAEVFPKVRADWLLTGRGPMKEPINREAVPESFENIRATVPGIPDAPLKVLQQLVPRLYLREKRRERAEEAREKAVEEARAASGDGEPEPISWPDVERPDLADVGPVPVEYAQDFVDQHLRTEQAVGTYGERTAALLSQLAAVYVAEFGSSKRPPNTEE